MCVNTMVVPRGEGGGGGERSARIAVVTLWRNEINVRLTLMKFLKSRQVATFSTVTTYRYPQIGQFRILTVGLDLA